MICTELGGASCSSTAMGAAGAGRLAACNAAGTSRAAAWMCGAVRSVPAGCTETAAGAASRVPSRRAARSLSARRVHRRPAWP